MAIDLYQSPGSNRAEPVTEPRDLVVMRGEDLPGWRSTSLGRMVPFQMLPKMTDDDLRALRAEVELVCDNATATMDSAVRGESLWHRAKGARRLANAYRKACRAEIANRAELVKLQAQQEKTRRHTDHQDGLRRQSKREWEAFRLLVIEEIGEARFVELKQAARALVLGGQN